MRTKKKSSSPGSRSKALTLKRLPAQERRRIMRPHNGFEAFVDLFAKLVAEHGDELGRVGIDVDAMRTSVANAQSLEPAHQAAAAKLAEAEEQLASVDDTQLVESSSAWQQMMLIYGRARQAARTNSQVEVALEPFIRFMKHRPRAKQTPAAAT